MKIAFEIVVFVVLVALIWESVVGHLRDRARGRLPGDEGWGE